MSLKFTVKPKTRKRLTRISVLLNVALAVIVFVHPGMWTVPLLGAAFFTAGLSAGLLTVRPPANARSLAQRNRYLEKQLDATRAKLEDEMTRQRAV